MWLYIYISCPSPTMAFSVFKPENESDKKDTRGGFESDNLSATYNLRWASTIEFTKWLEEEQRTKCYELNLQKTDKGVRFSSKYRYVCGRRRTGGEKLYAKLNSGRVRKVDEPKIIGCPCTLIVKTYLNTETVLGYFTHEHSHPLGEENLKFTYIPPAARERMLDMLRQHVDIDYIVCHLIISIQKLTQSLCLCF